MLFERTVTQKMLVGFDLRDDFCQISYMADPGHGIVKEPVTFSLTPGKDEYNIPTALCKAAGENKWLSGKEAGVAAGQAGSTYIPKLLSLALKGEPVLIEDKCYDPAALLALYIRRCFSLIAPNVPLKQIAAVTFTTRSMTRKMISVLETVTSKLELGCAVYYEGYANSYFNYMLAQPKELRMPASFLCDYDSSGVLYADKLIFNEKTTPVVAYREETEYTPHSLSPAEKDEEFLGILTEQLDKKHFGSAFLIGQGFGDNWMRTSVAYLCRGRRAFMGNNLYSKGAVYGSLHRVNPPQYVKDYYFLDSNKLRTNVGIRVLKHGEDEYLALVDAGINYYEVNGTTDIILEGGNELFLILTPVTGQGTSSFHIRLEGLPQREGRTARIRLYFSMKAPDKMLVRAEDMGFGEIFPSTGLKWEQEITV